MGGTPSVPEEKLSPERTFLVTGGNNGIGYETTKKIAQLGGRVIIACRSEEKAKDAIERMRKETELERKRATDMNASDGELNVQYMNLDLSSLTSTVDFARRFIETGFPLHVLVCNAGLGGREKVITEDGFEQQFQVNYLAHFLLTLLLLPQLKKSAPNCRVINVSSGAHNFGSVNVKNIQADKGFYGNSKLFQIMNMYSLSRLLTDQDVSVFSLHPGVVHTSFFSNGTGLSGTATRAVVSTLAKTPEQGSRTTLIAALDSQYDGKTALYFSGGKPTDPSRLSRNEEKQAFLWKYSLQCLRGKLDDVILQEIGEKLENIKPLEEND